MVVIHKQKIYPNSISDDTYVVRLMVPAGSKLRSIAEQGNQVCAWYECDNQVVDNGGFYIDIHCVGTGFGQVPEAIPYFSSVVNGQFVWHFYSTGIAS